MTFVLTLPSPIIGSTSTSLNDVGLLSAGRRLLSQALIAEPQRLAATIWHCFSCPVRNLMNSQPSSGWGDLAGSVQEEQAAPWNCPCLPPGLFVTSNLKVFFSAL